MTESDIDNVIAVQAALIAALDIGDVGAIEAATTSLSRRLAVVRANGAIADVSRDRIDHALRQTDAARTRVNYLADNTRQRLDRLAERCGARCPATYNSAGRFPFFGG